MSESRLYQWKIQDFAVLAIIPLVLLGGQSLLSIPKLDENHELASVLAVVIFVIGFLAAVFLLRDFLSSQWQQFKQRLWRNLFVCVCLTAATFALMSLARSVSLGSLEVDPDNDFYNPPLWLLLVSLVPAVLAAFTEELTFRYLLFGKFKGKLSKTVMFVVSSVLFGLVHWNNVGGNLKLLMPYMVMGAFFALIYWLGKNIWFAILAHFFYNSSIVLLPLLALLLMPILNR